MTPKTTAKTSPKTPKTTTVRKAASTQTFAPPQLRIDLSPVTRTQATLFAPYERSTGEPHPPARIDLGAERELDEYGDPVLRTQSYWRATSAAVIREIWGRLIPLLIVPRGVRGVTDQWWHRGELTALTPALRPHPFDLALAELVYADLVETEMRRVRSASEGVRRSRRGRVRCYRWVGPPRLGYVEDNHALYGLPPVPADILQEHQKARQLKAIRAQEAAAHRARMARLNTPISTYARFMLGALAGRGEGVLRGVSIISACRVVGLPTGRTLEVLRELEGLGLVGEACHPHSGEAVWFVTQDGALYWSRHEELRRFAGGEGGAKRGRPSKEDKARRARESAFLQPSLL